MSGLYSQFQPRYADLGVTVFPCAEIGDRKKPLVSNYLKMGIWAAADLAKKFSDANAMGFAAGARNRITVLDVDIADRRVLDTAIAKHGEPRLIVQTASGKFHGYYRYGRERRGVRAWGDELPIDLLGEGGFVMAPPSLFNDGQYQIIHGTLDDIRNLTPMHGLEDRHYGDRVQQQQTTRADEGRHSEKVRQGRRNRWLWEQCMRAAHHCDDIDALIDVAFTRNEECEPRLEEDEVMAVVQSAWGYTQAGKNRFGQRGAWMPEPEVACMMAEPDVLALLVWLRAKNAPDSTFWIANGLAESHFYWDTRRLAAARRRLIKLEYIVQITRAHQGSPALYRWA
jgi:Bifunctional DNA primase/polymerase, N-terminal/Primase C terminal 1 (PriCT-1)